MTYQDEAAMHAAAALPYFQIAAQGLSSEQLLTALGKTGVAPFSAEQAWNIRFEYVAFMAWKQAEAMMRKPEWAKESFDGD